MKYLICIISICISVSCAEWRFRTKVNLGLIDLDSPPPLGANITVYDFRLFRETPVWELTKAAVIQDTEKMKKIVREGKLNVDYQESKFGETLLSLEVKNERYDSSKTLLELGADPNKQENSLSEGYSPIMYGASVKDLRLLRLLLEYGGNPNIEAKGKIISGTITYTPLINASQDGKLENVKLLIRAGANIHFKDELGSTPLKEALIHNHMDIVLYLLQNGIDYKQQFGTVSGKNYNTKEEYPQYIADRLRFNTLPLNSERYKQKMKVVAFLKKNGIDYRATPIPLAAINEAKRLYPNYWEEYLEKY
ncbi:ankyrin repeat domain-containing protein [Leptospira ilyithenensis]|uniref:Ankyrin repeat domain-containing protein n=1 Tax=Leptospira ilyithenensis TaxID=2484901 RepID=A0A4R9LQ93_9LEPT|nr:ankyrin repeat domain-containing protein [Leptospira ilyithenensis]TGN10198.1 ankyrin repeat domain-containing protein [Leptospira ilyithenensis]